MKTEIKHTWHFNQSPEEVWEYLTKSELLELWMMKTDFKPIVGHKFTFICSNITYCEVLEVKPFTKLVYSWRTNSVKDGNPFDSKVEWTLIPKKQGTELQLVHNGFTALEDVAGHGNGWTTLGKQFVELLSSVEK